MAVITGGNTLPVDSNRFIRREAPLAELIKILQADTAQQGFTYVVAGAILLQSAWDSRAWYATQAASAQPPSSPSLQAQKPWARPPLRRWHALTSAG